MNEVVTSQLLERVQTAFGCRATPSVRSTQVLNCPYSTLSRVELNCDGATRTIYVKRVTSDDIGAANATSRVVLEFNTLSRLFGHFQNHPNWRVPFPVAVFPERQILITEEVPGVTLMERIGKSAKGILVRELPLLQRYCKLAGNWLQEFHAITTQGNAPFNFSGLLNYCDRRLETLKVYADSGVDATFIERFHDLLGRRYRAVQGTDDLVVGRHNDYSPHNIIVEGDRISVIDFGFFDHDSYLYDLGKFWFQLECMKSSPLYMASTVDRLQRSFLDGYGTNFDPRDPGFEMVVSRYFVTRMATMVTSGRRRGARGWVDRRTYRWCLGWLNARFADR